MQFESQPNIKTLNHTLGRQLQEVYDFFMQLRNERHFPVAVGRQLDGIGSIVELSRLQALIVSHLADMNVEMNDEMYRIMLAWKMFLNTSRTTYTEVHRLITMLWTVSPMIYYEDPDWPATIFFDTPMLTDNIWLDFRVLHIAIMVKAAGVQLIFRVRIGHKTDPTGIRVATVHDHSVRHGASPAYRDFTTRNTAQIRTATIASHNIRHGGSPGSYSLIRPAAVMLDDGTIITDVQVDTDQGILTPSVKFER